MCTCATLAPQSRPTPAPYPQVRIAQTSTVSARPKGCPAKRRWPETWDSPGHAGDTRRDQGRRRGSGLRVGATPGPSLPFSNSPASGRGPPHRTLATLSSMPVSPQGDHTCGPLSSSSWSPGWHGPRASSPHPSLSAVTQAEEGGNKLPVTPSCVRQPPCPCPWAACPPPVETRRSQGAGIARC